MFTVNSHEITTLGKLDYTFNKQVQVHDLAQCIQNSNSSDTEVIITIKSDKKPLRH